MHEIALVTKILDKAKELGAVREVQLEVGELSSIAPEEIEETMEQMSSLKVSYETKKSKVTCKSCGYTGQAKILERGHDFCFFTCSQCKQGKPDILEGGEIKITGVA